MTTVSVVGECFFWYRLTRVVPDKIHRAVKRLCVCVCVTYLQCGPWDSGHMTITVVSLNPRLESFPTRNTTDDKTRG